MKHLVTAEQMKHFDSYTINTIKIPSMVLMERASLAVRDFILSGNFDLTNVIVVAGYGNNGGDGLCVARLLKIAGATVRVVSVGNSEHESTEHAAQRKICQYYHIDLQTATEALADATLIVDAIFGIGIDRPIAGPQEQIINAINAVNAKIVAVDVPSGINTDTGEVMNVAVKATATVTFAFNKVGLTVAAGPTYAGQVEVAADMGTYAVDDN
ncbi:NAD(P)H-hydrate epimerase [Paucilactobacillus wasatchensis]|uniref:NAD(P)H-hydrate epimerase n=1 Tax=Paucilactobacillus wasatchensis TaxID=1335616 RepID=A0A0D0Y6I9_9LACO|nr:NAD(P)H-hydrate epimerase [Paucilactobacillus wasatchensis]KIS03893.1 NAD(P)HX epimerase [Paucilactobacillus wasatchensis]